MARTSGWDKHTEDRKTITNIALKRTTRVQWSEEEISRSGTIPTSTRFLCVHWIVGVFSQVTGDFLISPLRLGDTFSWCRVWEPKFLHIQRNQDLLRSQVNWSEQGMYWTCICQIQLLLTNSLLKRAGRLSVPSIKLLFRKRHCDDVFLYPRHSLPNPRRMHSTRYRSWGDQSTRWRRYSWASGCYLLDDTQEC